MELLLGIIVGLAILVFLVVVHELGHAIVAHRNGVVVEEFGIGFPPRAWAKKLKNGVTFTINYLPLGGFVKMQGENDASSKKGDYGAASFWSKTKILFAGVVINWLVAAILLTILAVTGLPKIFDNQFSIASDTTISTQPVQLTSLVDHYPAKQAGFEPYDKIISVDGQAIDTTDQLVQLTADKRGQTIDVVYSRGGKKAEKSVSLKDGDSANFGATLGQQELIKATWSAPIVGVATTGQFTWVTFEGLGKLVGNLTTGLVQKVSFNSQTRDEGSQRIDEAGDSVAGPVGILGVIFPSAREAGLTQLTFLTAIISLTLAVMNVLPIPALDGGRWFLMTLYKFRKKELTKEKEEKIVGISFLILMLLIIVITFADVSKIAH